MREAMAAASIGARERDAAKAEGALTGGALDVGMSGTLLQQVKLLSVCFAFVISDVST
jgi:hypothetical protein